MSYLIPIIKQKDDEIAKLKNTLQLHAGDAMSLSNELNEWRERALAAEEASAYLRKAIQDYLDGNYDCPRSHRHDEGPNKGCAHGRFYWEDCGNCIDDYFAGVLNPQTEGKSL